MKTIPRGRYCTNHYRHIQEYGEILPRAEVLARALAERRAKNPLKECAAVNCSVVASVRGLCDKHYGRLMRTGTTSLVNRTGRRLNDQGYVMLKDWQHPRHGANGYVREHDVVMEGYLRRVLRHDERVHHIDEDRANNEIQNLVLFSPPGRHNSYHNYIRWQSPETADCILRDAMLCQVRESRKGNYAIPGV